MPPEDDEPISFDKISELYRQERTSTKLTKLPEDFYRRLGEYKDELYQSYMKEYGKNPTSTKALMLNDELRRVSKRAEHIYEFRERKIVIMALASAKSGQSDTQIMTPEELLLFESQVDACKRSRQMMLERKADAQPHPPRESGKESPRDAISDMPDASGRKDEDVKTDHPPTRVEEREEKSPKTEEPEEESHRLEAKEDGTAGKEAPQEPSGNEETEKEGGKCAPDETDPDKGFVLAHVLEDIPPFATPEKDMRLSKGDVVTLPRDIARILLTHGKIEKLDSGMA